MTRYNREQIPAQLTPEQAEQFRRTPTTGLPLHVLNRLPRINAADLDADIADAPSILQHRSLPVRGPNKSPWISQHSVKPDTPTRTFSEGLRLGKAMVIVGALAVSSFTDAMAGQSASMLEELERQQQAEIAFERAVVTPGMLRRTLAANRRADRAAERLLPTESDLAERGIRQAAAGRGDDLGGLDHVREQVDDFGDDIDARLSRTGKWAADSLAGIWAEVAIAKQKLALRGKPIDGGGVDRPPDRPGLRTRADVSLATQRTCKVGDFGCARGADTSKPGIFGIGSGPSPEVQLAFDQVDQGGSWGAFVAALLESRGQEVAITINFDHQRQPTRETQLTETADGRLLVSVLPDDSWGYQQRATTTGGRQVLLTAPASAEEIKAAGGATPGPIDPPPQLPDEAIGELAAVAASSDYARFN